MCEGEETVSVGVGKVGKLMGGEGEKIVRSKVVTKGKTGVAREKNSESG